MKQLKIMTVLVLFIASSCGTSKTNDTIPIQKESNILYEKTWQLEFISGNDTSFGELFPDKKPELKFVSIGNKVSGNAGCNGYSSTFTKNGDEIAFSDPGPATLMYCGEGEQQFLKAMTQINRYSIDSDGKLNLMVDDIPVLRFHKL